MRPAGSFQITAVYQLRPGLFTVRVLVASRGHSSGRSPFHEGLQVSFPNNSCKQHGTVCWTDRNCKCYIKCNESPKIFGGM